MGVGSGGSQRSERSPELITEHPDRLHTANVTSLASERFDEHGE